MGIRTILTIGAVAITTFVGIPTMASATPIVHIIKGQGAKVCPAGKFCLYENEDFNADKSVRVFIADKQEEVNSLGAYRFDNATSSIINNTDHSVELYRGENFTGTRWVIQSGERVSFAKGHGWNDKVSSFKPAKSLYVIRVIR